MEYLYQVLTVFGYCELLYRFQDDDDKNEK